MKITTTIMFVLWIALVTAQQMVAVFSPIANNGNLGKSVCISDTKSAVYSFGEFLGEFELGGNSITSNANQTVFFTKINTLGSHEWINSIRGTRDVFASKISTKGNRLIVGGVYSDSVFIGSDTLINTGQKGFYIAVYDTLGAFQYSLNPSCSSAELTDFVITENNELIVVGSYYQEIDFAGQNYNSPLGSNFYILSYNLTNRTENWFQHSTGTNNSASKVRQDSNGNLIVVGSYGEGAKIDTQLLLENGNEHNMYVAKFNEFGGFLWVESLIGLSQVHGLGLAIGDNDDVYISGEFELTVNVPNGSTLSTKGLMDGLLFKYNKDGNFLWAKQVGGDDADAAHDIVIDINGNPLVLLNAGRQVLLGGNTMDANGFNEPLLVKVNKFDGSYIWHKRIPSLSSSGVVLSKSIAIIDSSICVVGANYTGIEHNGNLIVSPNIHDYFMSIIIDHDYAEYPINNAFIDNLEGNYFSVYPNPFNSEFIVTSGQKISRIEIYALDGKLTFTKNIKETQCAIAPTLNSGSYFLKIVTENNTITTKIIKL